MTTVCTTHSRVMPCSTAQDHTPSTRPEDVAAVLAAQNGEGER